MTDLLTPEEVFDSLNGFDELSITQHFGRTISDLTADPSMFARALLFVVKRREGINDDDARNAVMAMPLGDVNAGFADESPESGKDDAAPEPPPEK